MKLAFWGEKKKNIELTEKNNQILLLFQKIIVVKEILFELPIHLYGKPQNT